MHAKIKTLLSTSIDLVNQHQNIAKTTNFVLVQFANLNAKKTHNVKIGKYVTMENVMINVFS